jgi:hypothetical protein
VGGSGDGSLDKQRSDTSYIAMSGLRTATDPHELAQALQAALLGSAANALAALIIKEGIRGVDLAEAAEQDEEGTALSQWFVENVVGDALAKITALKLRKVLLGQPLNQGAGSEQLACKVASLPGTTAKEVSALVRNYDIWSGDLAAAAAVEGPKALMGWFSHMCGGPGISLLLATRMHEMLQKTAANPHVSAGNNVATRPCAAGPGAAAATPLRQRCAPPEPWPPLLQDPVSKEPLPSRVVFLVLAETVVMEVPIFLRHLARGLWTQR